MIPASGISFCGVCAESAFWLGNERCPASRQSMKASPFLTPNLALRKASCPHRMHQAHAFDEDRMAPASRPRQAVEVHLAEVHGPSSPELARYRDSCSKSTGSLPLGRPAMDRWLFKLDKGSDQERGGVLRILRALLHGRPEFQAEIVDERGAELLRALVAMVGDRGAAAEVRGAAVECLGCMHRITSLNRVWFDAVVDMITEGEGGDLGGVDADTCRRGQGFSRRPSSRSLPPCSRAVQGQSDDVDLQAQAELTELVVSGLGSSASSALLYGSVHQCAHVLRALLKSRSIPLIKTALGRMTCDMGGRVSAFLAPEDLGPIWCLASNRNFLGQERPVVRHLGGFLQRILELRPEFLGQCKSSSVELRDLVRDLDSGSDAQRCTALQMVIWLDSECWQLLATLGVAEPVLMWIEGMDSLDLARRIDEEGTNL